MNMYMKEAINEAYSGIRSKHGGPFGCVIVKDGDIVGRGHNEVLKNQDCTCHGEIMAIRDASKNLKTFNLEGCDLYTTSAPCPMCKGAIQWANINKIFVGCSIQDAEDIGFRDRVFYDSDSDMVEVDRNACLLLFKEYVNTNPTTY